ncbi:ABC-three component system middle component 2 [Listeria monocytogenes]|uniref:ABC-three component system middle component 2 n=1 Tax=Listeria monocytogenes TaxID=1639 RepID=UPI002A90963C|nr:ABC-three component system middle component 2 [Listeria monocytogenes]
MNNPFNSRIEISSRILLTLANRKNEKLNLEGLVISDFVTVYAREFGLSDTNLHGNNEFSFAEFMLRRQQFEETIPFLVRQNLVNVATGEYGFEYSINNRGEQFISGFNSDYVKKYRNLTKLSAFYTDKLSQGEILSLITRKATNSLDGRKY